MLEAILKIPSYYSFRSLGRPRKLPMNLTLSITYNCNSRCKTCNVYTKKTQELSLTEWRSIFSNLQKTPFWITMSGGEPFLRRDFKDLVCSLYDHCRPSIINIPTNGILKEQIPDIIKDISSHCSKSQIVVNLSIDDIGERHDVIRGVQGNYEKALETLSALKSLDMQNLSIGIHTVISKFNVSRIPEIYEHLRRFKPDSYVTEIAEERVELDTIGADISPPYEEYSKSIDFLAKAMTENHFHKIGGITRAFRTEYYQQVKRILIERRQIIPCFAGFASAQIAPNGDVWMCCTKAESIGNLRDAAYDFNKVWFSNKAEILRRQIKNGQCYCPLANASYTNMLHHWPTLLRVGWNLVKPL